jgi:uncharacterized membrane protein required for colicin V production
MSWVDVALVSAAAVALAAGLYTGFLRLVLAAAGLGTGLWMAWHYAPAVAARLGGTLGSERAAYAASFALLVAATVGGAALLTWLLSRTLKVFRLGWADRTAGGLLALGGLTALAAVFALSLGVDASATAPGGSRLLPLLARQSRRIATSLGLPAAAGSAVSSRPVEGTPPGSPQARP